MDTRGQDDSDCFTAVSKVRMPTLAVTWTTTLSHVPLRGIVGSQGKDMDAGPPCVWGRSPSSDHGGGQDVGPVVEAARKYFEAGLADET
jgi:hypothetical protein